MGIRKIGFEDGKWIDLAKGYIQQRAFVPALLIRYILLLVVYMDRD
jgi:hypothetical protein